MTIALPSQQYLRDILDYDPETGLLTWKFRPEHPTNWNNRYAGKTAFSYRSTRGYYIGAINGTTFRAHRVIWKWVHGTDPVEVDHINGDHGDNRQINLRSVNHAENMKNQKMRNTNTSGITGVRREKGSSKWRATIGKAHIGYFDKLADAVRARQERARAMGFSPRHG